MYVSLGRTYNEMYPIRAVIDTGAGLHLLHARVIQVDWEKLVTNQSAPTITDAAKNKMCVSGQIVRSTQVGYLEAKLAYCIASSFGS